MTYFNVLVDCHFSFGLTRYVIFQNFVENSRLRAELMRVLAEHHHPLAFLSRTRIIHQSVYVSRFQFEFFTLHDKTTIFYK